MTLAGKPEVLLRLLTDTVCETLGQGIAKKQVKFRCIRQPKSRKYAPLIFYADQILPALLLHVHHVVVCLVCLIATVRYKDTAQT